MGIPYTPAFTFTPALLTPPWNFNHESLPIRILLNLQCELFPQFEANFVTAAKNSPSGTSLVIRDCSGSLRNFVSGVTLKPFCANETPNCQKKNGRVSKYYDNYLENRVQIKPRLTRATFQSLWSHVQSFVQHFPAFFNYDVQLATLAEIIFLKQKQSLCSHLSFSRSITHMAQGLPLYNAFLLVHDDDSVPVGSRKKMTVPFVIVRN